MEINAYVRETTILTCPYSSARCQRKDFFNHVERHQGSAKDDAASPRYPRGRSGDKNQN